MKSGRIYGDGWKGGGGRRGRRILGAGRDSVNHSPRMIIEPVRPMRVKWVR